MSSNSLDDSRRSLLTGWAAAGVGTFLSQLASAAAPSIPTWQPRKGWGPPKFQIVHLYAGADGFSHIAEVSLSQLAENDPSLFNSPAKEIGIGYYPAGKRWEWHHAGGERRLITLLKGLMVTIVNEGGRPGEDYYPFKPGTVMLCEDNTGRGHKGWAAGDEDGVTFDLILRV